MCSGAFIWRPWFYHNPVANITVMSMYRPSGGENAGFRTEVTIKHGSQCWKSDFDFDWKMFWDTTSLTDLTAGFPSDGACIRCWLLLYHFLWRFFLLFWNDVKTLKMWDTFWAWKSSGMLGISGKPASMQQSNKSSTKASQPGDAGVSVQTHAHLDMKSRGGAPGRSQASGHSPRHILGLRQISGLSPQSQVDLGPQPRKISGLRPQPRADLRPQPQEDIRPQWRCLAADFTSHFLWGAAVEVLVLWTQTTKKLYL